MDRYIRSHTVLTSCLSHPNRNHKFTLLQIIVLIAALIALCSSAVSFAANRSPGTETMLYSFAGGNDGATPAGALIWSGDGSLFGTTMTGGPANKGTIFKLTPTANGWTESVLYSFTGGNDGATPASALVFDAQGNLYGTTVEGGLSGQGVVFKLAPAQGAWTLSVVYAFGGGNSGGRPASGVVIDANGNLYGTTSSGGFFGGGVIYELTYSYGVWRESLLHAFGAGIDGRDPEAGISVDRFGNIYGTTYAGGVYGNGAVYKLSYINGSYSENLVYSFTGGNDGANPRSGVVIGAGGSLLGTTYAGGWHGSGVLYQLAAVSALGWRQIVIHDFTGLNGGDDGDRPRGDLIVNRAGHIFGVTSKDGTGGYGTLFEAWPVASLGWQFRVLHGFAGGSDGMEPLSGACFDVNGHLYGTTSAGGAHGYGAVYEVEP